MRRALRNIVPIEILERRRKAFLSRGPIASLQEAEEKIKALFDDSIAAALGFVDIAQIRLALDLTIRGKTSKWSSSIMRLIAFELWLRAESVNHRTTTLKIQRQTQGYCTLH